MGQTAWFLGMCLKRFGFVRGCGVYYQLKVSHNHQFCLPGYAGALNHRPGTVDLVTFREVFLREAYRIPFPSEFQPATIIDAGANIGFTSVFWAKFFPNARIAAIEPEPENFELLAKNASPYPAIRPIHGALWKYGGQLAVRNKGYGLRGFMTEETTTPAEDTVPGYTIPQLMQMLNWPAIDLLKMDIEGSEKEIFEADTSWLGSVRCLVIELHDRMKPGSTQAVTNAILQHSFNRFTYQESEVFINRLPSPPAN